MPCVGRQHLHTTGVPLLMSELEKGRYESNLNLIDARMEACEHRAAKRAVRDKGKGAVREHEEELEGRGEKQGG